MLNKSSILILGAGYVGTKIIDTFYHSYDIVCIDHGKNFLKLEIKFPSVKFVKDDCTNENLLNQYAKNCKYVFYTMDMGGVMDCIISPKKYEKINLYDFRTILNILKKFDISFFLFSSSFVYPDHPNISETNPPNPETHYGELRLQQENILKNSNINYIILRLPNLFGFSSILNVGNLGIIENFIQQSFLKKKINLHGSGTQKLDCLYLDDLMNLLKKIIITNLPCKIFNVSTRKSYSVLEIAKIIKEISLKKFNLKVELSFSNKSMLMKNSPIMSSKNVLEYYDWQPKVTNLSEKIEEMMQIYSKHVG